MFPNRMARNKNVASGKRFGSRYGRRNRDKYAHLEGQARKKYPCPSCQYTQVTRVAAGIWECKKCGLKFASKAFTVAKPITLRTHTEDI